MKEEIKQNWEKSYTKLLNEIIVEFIENFL